MGVVCSRAEPFYGVPAHTLACLDGPWSPGTYRAPVTADGQVSPANLTAGHALQPLVPPPPAPLPARPQLLSPPGPRPPGPRLPALGQLGVGRQPAPWRALHLKGISRDPQKPATLIAGISFLVSFEGCLQVCGVISREPAATAHCARPCVPATWPLARTPNKHDAGRRPHAGLLAGARMGHTAERGLSRSAPPSKPWGRGLLVPFFCFSEGGGATPH